MVLGHNNHCGMKTHTWYNCLIYSTLSFNPLTIKNKSYITVKNGFCNLSGYKVFITLTPMEVLMEHSCKCCDLILSLVQLLFSFVSIRIAKFFPRKGCFSHPVIYVFTRQYKTDHAQIPHYRNLCLSSHT